MTTCRIGIMGGTFDPIHIGHLVAAEEVYHQFSLNKVIFMPAGHPALKPETITDAAHRLEMTRLATASNPHFAVSPLEVEREGVTYTVDTIEQLREQYPQPCELFFITGADAVLEIIGWKDAKRLADMVTFVGVTRPGYDLEQARLMHEADESSFDVRYIQVPALAVSSTDIRERAQTGRPIRYLVPDEVADYMHQHNLYEESSQVGDAR